MGNVPCAAEDAAHLALIAQDICPFPNYNPNPLFLNLLSTNSSLHLKNHYTAVQSSLTEKQLDLFTQGLRTTFGREGRVTLGGVGVVALSLALFFDILSKQVKAQYVPESGIISDLFLKDPRGYYPPQVYTLSEYLRLVPYIANNPTRMREETERYLNRLIAEQQNLEFKERKEDVIGINRMCVMYLQKHMIVHLLRITNSTVKDGALRQMLQDSVQENSILIAYMSPAEPSQSKLESPLMGGQFKPPVMGGYFVPKYETSQSKHSKKRKRGFVIPPLESNATLNFNCNPERASERFWAEVQKSKVSLEAFSRCQQPMYIPKTFMHFVAGITWLKSSLSLIFDFSEDYFNILVAQSEAFDLKSNALKEWTK